MNGPEVRERLRAAADPAQVAVQQRYFKTGSGGYGEGDVFIGVKVPFVRNLLPGLDGLDLDEIKELLHSKVHEERLLALLLLVRRYERCRDEVVRKRIHELYLAHTAYVNNWDLVDTSAPTLVGAFLENRSRDLLYRLVRSKNIWERRIAMVATLRFIRSGNLAETFRLAEHLLDDPEDLIHKAAGWMLREAGKRDQKALEAFLDSHGRRMPRTMLRYAIEKFPANKRQHYLMGKKTG